MAVKGSRPFDGRTAKTQTRIEDQTERCLELRAQGLALRTIGRELGISHERVRVRLADAYAAIKSPKVEAVRLELGSQMDHLLSKLAPKVNDGDLKAIDSALRILTAKARLFGAEVPVHAQLDVTVDASPYLDPSSELARLQAQVAVLRAQASIDAAVVATVQRPAIAAAPSA